MKFKGYVAGLVSGVLISSAVVIGAQYNIYENPYKIFVDGKERQIQGYNIDDYSYFKLRDIADAVGGFEVDFKDNTIVLKTDKNAAVGGDKEMDNETKNTDENTNISATAISEEDALKILNSVPIYTEDSYFDMPYVTPVFDVTNILQPLGIDCNCWAGNGRSTGVAYLIINGGVRSTIRNVDLWANQMPIDYYQQTFIPFIINYAKERGLIK